MERLARVEVLHDRLRQVGPHHPREPHLREGRELLGHARVRVLGFIFELQRRPDALDSDRGARPRQKQLVGDKTYRPLEVSGFLAIETCPQVGAYLQ